ncbi:MAG TPA: ABC transporter permease, partial [Ilumatobacteraceae bacterium]|nr:ABC transporter permease [Ilumatobacteraceae bacterium]
AARVARLGVNPSLSSVAMANAMREFEGVREMHSDALMLASIGASGPHTLTELTSNNDNNDQWLQVLGSPDGRFIDVDRPVVTSGRLPDGDHEVFINDEERRVLETIDGHALSVGDSLDLSFWWGGLGLPSQDPNEVVSPIGVESLRISGFGHLPDEVLPDELYPRQRMIVSEDVARTYSCIGDYNAGMTDEEAAAAAFPKNCSQQYWFYTFQLDGAPGRVDSIRQQFAAAADRLTADLPPFIAGQAQYYYISQDRAVVDDAVQRATRPAVTALTVFAILALAATLVIFGIALARIFRRAEPEFRSLMQLGASPAQRVLGAIVPAIAAVVVGVAGAVGIGALLSPIGPIGSVRDLVRSPGPSLPGRVTVTGAVVLMAALAAVSLAVDAAATRRAALASRRPQRRAVRLSNALSRFSRPSMTTGTSAALDVSRPGTVAAITGCVVAVLCAVGSLMFGSNLTRLVESPVQYGWPWDVGVITGGGFDNAVPEAISASLDADKDVENYALYAFDSSSLFGDQGVPVVYGFSADAPFEFPLLSGRPPRNANEAVLGGKTADRLGLSVGDHIAVRSGLFPETSVEVVGTAVLPALGSFVSDRAGLGDGAFVLTGEPPTPESASFVAIHLRKGVDRQAFIRRLEPTLPQWDAVGDPPLTYVRPIRSAEIVNVSELRSAPLILGGVLGVALFGGLALAIVVSVRDRQRELVTLRALGFRDAQLRASVRWQACLMMVVGLLIGLPLGIVGGRLAWRAFADQLGVAMAPRSPIWIVIATIVGAMVLALIAAAIPARSATRTSHARIDA